MALENETLMLSISLLFNYFLVYRKHKIIGGIFFLVLGIAFLTYSQTLTATAEMEIASFTIILGSILNIIFNIFVNLGAEGQTTKNI